MHVSIAIIGCVYDLKPMLSDQELNAGLNGLSDSTTFRSNGSPLSCVTAPDRGDQEKMM